MKRLTQSTTALRFFFCSSVTTEGARAECSARSDALISASGAGALGARRRPAFLRIFFLVRDAIFRDPFFCDFFRDAVLLRALVLLRAFLPFAMIYHLTKMEPLEMIYEW